MKTGEKCLFAVSLLLAVSTFAIPINAMHIMEGYLPLGWSIGWSAAAIPFLAISLIFTKRLVAQHPKTILVLAMCAAYAFALSALKIPSVTGSSSHATGTGLGAILFGPMVMPLIGLCVLLFQALLLAHGGLTTLGANVCSMAVVGPLVAWGVYQLAVWLRLKRSWAVFFAAMLGDLCTYLLTSLQLGFAHPDITGGVAASVLKFLGVFAITQLPLAVIEGILTVLVLGALERFASEELHELGFLKEVGNYA